MLRVWKLVLVIACLCCSVAMAADWPNFLGPNRNGIAPDTGLNKDWAAKPPKELWRVPMNDNGFAGPSVAAGKVFIVDHNGSDDIVRALNFETGQQVWQQAYPDTAKFDYGFCRSTPVYSDGKLYVFSRLGTASCLDAETGKFVWSKNLKTDMGGRSPGWDYAGSPLIDGDRLIICMGAANGNVACLDKNTGNPIWTGGNADVAGHTSVIPAQIMGKKQYVVPTATSVIGVDAETGKLAWSIPWQNKCSVNASQPIVEGNYVFVTSGYGIGCALYEVTGGGAVARWRNNTISAHFSSPLYYNGFIYSNGEGTLVCMNPQDGSTKWRQTGFEKGGLLIADGVILAINGKDGDLVMVKALPDSYQELGRIKPLGGQSWTAPIISEGRVIIRNLTALACLDLR